MVGVVVEDVAALDPFSVGNTKVGTNVIGVSGGYLEVVDGSIAVCTDGKSDDSMRNTGCKA